MSQNLKKWLTERKEKIVAEVQKGKDRKGLSELPDGTYIALYKVHEFGESQNENVGLKTCLKVLEGDQAGEDIWIWEDLDRDNAFEWLTVRLKNSGVEVEDAQDIYDQLAKNPTDVFDLVANRTVVKVTLRSKKSTDGNVYQNKNINKVLPDYEIDEAFLQSASENQGSEKPEKVEDVVEETASEASEENEVTLSVGMKITFKKGKTTLEGEVTELNADDQIVTVKTADKKVHEVGLDAVLTVLEQEQV